MMRILLPVSIVVLLCSCAGKGFLHQRYTHYDHTKYRAEKQMAIETGEEIPVAILPKKEVPLAEPAREITIRNIQGSQESKQHGKIVYQPTTISTAKKVQAKDDSSVRRSVGKAQQVNRPDLFTLLAIILWVLVGLLLLALVVAVIGIIIMLASRLILGIILTALGILGIVLWCVTWG